MKILKLFPLLYFLLPTVVLGIDQPIPQLIVSGESTLSRSADEATLRLGVVTEAEEASEALQKNSEAMDAVIEVLKASGMKDSEYQTGQFHMFPQYSQRPRNAPEDWQPQVRGYRVENKVIIKTQQLTTLGSWIDAAVQKGANAIDQISFGLHKPRTYRNEAIADASKNAKEDAEALAESIGIGLGRVLSVQLDQTSYQPLYRSVEAYSTPQLFRASAAPPIAGGDVTVHAKVTVAYEIINTVTQ